MGQGKGKPKAMKATKAMKAMKKKGDEGFQPTQAYCFYCWASKSSWQDVCKRCFGDGEPESEGS